jgi:hypothetical protein
VAAYEEFPIETNSADLGNDAKAWLADRWPGWVASPANFDAGMIDANALMAAEVRDIAASVPDDIFRRQGAIAGIYPLEAIPATLTATVVATDTLGYTLQAGTVFSLRATGDTVALFTVNADVVIPPLSSSTAVGGVAMTAQEPGALPNGLTGALTPSDRTLPWFSSATTVTPAAGGVDAEATSAFLIRLATEFRLSAPRPILPADFADFAKRDLAVDRATAIDLYVPGTNEKQTISHNGTGGSFTVTVMASTSGSIVWNATAAQVKTALEAASGVGAGNLIVTGGPLPAAVTVEFTGARGEANVAAMVTAVNSLTPATPTITYTTTVGGVAPASGVEKAIAVYVVDENGLDPGQTARDRVDADLQARRESQFLITVRAPGYDDVSVVFTAKALPGWDPAEVELRAEQAVTDWLTPKNVGVPQFGDDPAGVANGRPWIYDSKIRLGELVEVLNRVDGIWYLTGPGANGMPTIEGSAADYTLSFGPTAVVLPTPGTVAGTVVA